MRYTTHRGVGARFNEGGYSLVEVSLAMLVIGVGLLAVFALFPEGLGAARRAVDDVETTMFAEHVFAALAYEADVTDTNDIWNTFGAGMELLKSHALEWNGQPVIRANSGFSTISSFYWIPFFYGGSEWGVSTYRLTTFTYKLDIGNVEVGSQRKFARLEVWPGEYPAGVTPTSRGRVFYREFMPPN